MIIVNTTFCLHTDIEHPILEWMRNVYLPSAIKCGAIGDELLTRIVSDEEDETCSYALHINFNTMEEARHWNEGVGQSLRQILNERWGEKALTFHTYLETIDNNHK